MKLLRAGIYEYDKRKSHPVKNCAACGCEIPAGKQKERCAPCADARYEELLAARRHKYRGRVYGKAKLAHPTT